MPQRRNLEARIRALLGGKRLRGRVARALRALTPYTTDKPLIRVGGNGDGGYLIPDDLEGISACFSPGVSDEIGFDLKIAEMGIPGFLADASVEAPPGLPESAVFDPLFLGPRTEGAFISLDDWVARYAPEATNLLLQMDIEGAEYEVLAAASDETLGRFRIALIEFHKIYHLLRADKSPIIEAALEKMSKHFVVAHIHANNAQPPVEAAGFVLPPVFEVTFLRRDRVSKMTETTDFPHPLDAPNAPGLPDFPMPAIWKTPT